jgi:hypothetical protein
MRTAIALFLLTLSIVFALFLKINSDAILSEYKYIGADKCKPCHSISHKRDQYIVWEKSAHSKAMVSLNSKKAEGYALANSILNLAKNENCLKCHSTGFSKTYSAFELTFDISKGVQCEECHSGGSEYSKYNNMVLEKLFLSNGGKKGDINHCYDCHSSDVKNKKIDKCPFQEVNFNSKVSFKKIEHPIIK